MFIQPAHTIKVRYVGPTDYRGSVWRLIWGNWPSKGGVVSRDVPYYDFPDSDAIRLEAARQFAEWLSSGFTVGLNRCVKSITVGSLDADTDVLLVTTEIKSKEATAQLEGSRAA